MKRTAVPILAGIFLLAAVLAVVWYEGGRGPSPAIFPGALSRFVPAPLPAPKKPMELSGPDARVGSDFIWARWHPGPGQLHEVNVQTITLTPKGTNEVDYYMEFPHQGVGGAAYVWDWPY
jgi:hypothetical protein